MCVENNRWDPPLLLILENWVRTFVSNLVSLSVSPVAFSGMSIRWKCASMTIWTSSALTTPTTRCRRMQLSVTCCTWWRERTTRCASLTPSISSAGSARGPSLLMLPKNSRRSFNASPPSPWERSSVRERAIIISVSIFNDISAQSSVVRGRFLVLNFSLCLTLSAKPMHHHGKDCLRLRVDVVGHKGSGKNHYDKSKARETEKILEGEKVNFPATGGVHNPSNRLPAGEHSLKNRFQT